MTIDIKAYTEAQAAYEEAMGVAFAARDAHAASQRAEQLAAEAIATAEDLDAATAAYWREMHLLAVRRSAFYEARARSNRAARVAEAARAPLLAEQRRLLAIEEPSEAEAAEEAALHEALGPLSARQAEGE